jgi:hypothetical protein
MSEPLRSKIRLRRLTGNLLLSALTLLIILTIIEFTLDRTHWLGARRTFTRPDPLLRYRFQPEAEYWFWEENDHPITGRINSWGWRDRPRDLHKPANVYRVAVLGDSYVEAFQVESDSTFALLAEDELNRRADGQGSTTRFEILNFGRSGFTQSEEWLVLLHDAGRFNPDLVLLFFYPGNDIRDIHPETSDAPRPYFSVNPDGELILDVSFRRSRNYRLRSFLNPLQRHSALVSLLVKRLVTSRQSARMLEKAVESTSAVDTIAGYRSLQTQHPDPRYQRNYAINKRLIQRMAEYCRSQGMQLLVVCMPESYQEKTQERLKRIDASFEPGFFAADIESLASALRVGSLSLQNAFEAAAGKGETLQWVHWNYRGHALVAAQVVAALSSLHALEP